MTLQGQLATDEHETGVPVGTVAPGTGTAGVMPVMGLAWPAGTAFTAQLTQEQLFVGEHWSEFGRHEYLRSRSCRNWTSWYRGHGLVARLSQASDV